ncbi:MAG TPA: flagellar basal body P-ring protein FlgI, partial [Lacipirellulaceae bacterium]|nr:flagellar basal body P-ring protein FlgI [Lacipirellulaceae bacterium]
TDAMHITTTPMRRRSPLLGVWAACVAAGLGAGCMGPIFRPQSPDAALTEAELKLDPPSQTQLVGAVAHPYGMNVVKVETVALVTGLAGTGEDPAPSPQRAALLSEMNRRSIEAPNEVLASPNTALVLVRAFLRPGIQPGDKFDVEVRTPSRSDTTSLRGGMLLETRMKETAVLGSAIHYGHESAIAQGPILVDPSATSAANDALAIQGRVLSGGVAIKGRKVGLIIDHEHRSIRMSQIVAKAVNDRFHTYIDGRRMGVATPKTDEYIEIALHPRYKENVGRYMRVVRAVAVRETPVKRLERLQMLRDQLLDPVTAETAALRLEAVGADAIAILKEGAKAEDPEVRFYAAEALAYLDITEAVAPLARAAVDEPAFRVAALAALGSMEDGAASEVLFDMLKLKSAETRYGAFRALTVMAPNDPRIRGERLGGRFNYHRLNVEGPAMIHVTSSHKPEIVVFGGPHEFRLPVVLDAGQRILVNGLRGGEIKVSRFGPNEPTQERIVSTKVDDVIRAVVDLGGDYPDVIQMLQQAKNAGALTSRFRVNALPEPGREFDRGRDSAADDVAADETDRLATVQ